MTMTPDVNRVDCPSRGILEHVTSRWGVLVLAALLERSFRFSELRRRRRRREREDARPNPAGART